MKYMIYTLIIALMSIVFWNWQVEGNMQTLAIERAKHCVIRAAHDASLQVDIQKVMQGELVFNQQKAEEVFVKSLRKNMQLDESLIPLERTFYIDLIEIVYVGFFDDSTVSMSYPYFISIETNEYLVADHINGPAVVFVIKAKNPFTTNSEAIDIYVSAIYEYPGWSL